MINQYSARCPKCGSKNIIYDTSKVLTSNPPKYECKCSDCGDSFYSDEVIKLIWSNADSLDGTWFKHDQSILNTPKIADPIPGQQWSDPFKLPPPTKGGSYGWICPKCGRVMAPFVDSCKFCDGGNTLAVTPNTLNDYLSKSISDSNSITAIPNPTTKLTNDSELLNYLTTSNSIENKSENVKAFSYCNNENCVDDKEAMKQKFINESESIFEAVDNYIEWEKTRNENTKL